MTTWTWLGTVFELEVVVAHSVMAVEGVGDDRPDRSGGRPVAAKEDVEAVAGNRRSASEVVESTSASRGMPIWSML